MEDDQALPLVKQACERLVAALHKLEAGDKTAAAILIRQAIEDLDHALDFLPVLGPDPRP